MSKEKREKLWTKDFLLIWQGQLVSTLGDAAYSVALGFWVLQATGSTALMGSLMAASALPGILISPFAGVWVDRMNKKALLVSMDLLRGIGMVLIAAAAFAHVLAVWMVFAAGILLSVCGAVFRPGVNASIPSMVPPSRLSNAISVQAAAQTGSNMLGCVAGGYFFQLFGAPLLFLFNGLSYFFSGVSLCFIRFAPCQEQEKQNFRENMNAGFRFMWSRKGLRYLLAIAAVMNFFCYIAIVLFLPLFQKTAALGAARYGLAMACYMGGAMAGFLCFSAVTIPPRRKAASFIASIGINCISLAFAVNQQQFWVMLPLILLGGFFNSVVNVILQSTVQINTPDEMRGKVQAFLNMTTQSLTPFAMALGGLLASFLPMRAVITASFLITFAFVTPFAFVKPFTRFIGCGEK